MKQFLSKPPPCGCHVWLDQTAVGRAVKAMFKAILGDDTVWSAVVTGGQALSRGDDGATWVPRRELASVVQVMLQGRRLKVAADLPLADTLARELAAFRTHMPSLNENAIEPWRERSEDDLVLAVALALWDGEPEPADVGVPMVLGRRD